MNNIHSPMSKVVVVIPVYRDHLRPLESIGAARCLDILGKHPIVVVAPRGLSIPAPLDKLPCHAFDPRYFTSISAYSQLLLSHDFYAQFLKYDYMLLHQLDAFVFRDDLLAWCNRGYDYIGAPWLNEAWPNEAPIRQGLPFWTRSRLFKFLPPLDHRVGNGGFSLRKTRTMHQALTCLPRTLRAWGGRNEDQFWSIAIPECWWWRYRTPDVHEALAFAFETTPADSFELNQKKLPFGCHAWEQYDPEFWLPHFRAVNCPFDLDMAKTAHRTRTTTRPGKAGRS
jgi:hypothetical protein